MRKLLKSDLFANSKPWFLTTTLPTQLNSITSADHTWPCWGNPRTQDWHCRPKKGKIRPNDVIVAHQGWYLIITIVTIDIKIITSQSCWDLHSFRGMTKGQPQFLGSWWSFFLRVFAVLDPDLCLCFVGTLVPYENSHHHKHVCALGLLCL